MAQRLLRHQPRTPIIDDPVRTLNTLQRLISTRRPPRALRWSARDASGAVAPGGRLIQDGFRRASTPSWPAPLLLATEDGPLHFEPLGGSIEGCLIVFTQATVSGQSGVIELVDGSLLAEPAWDSKNVSPSPANWRRRLRLRQRQKGPWFSCLLHYAYGYYHWVCDVLPRFHRVVGLLPPATKFLVPWTMEQWQWDALAAIGVDRARCVQFPVGRDWVFDELYYAPPAAPTGEHDADAIRWVRDTVLESLRVPLPPAADKQLFVTRRLANRRRLVDEAALWPTLAAAGFEIVEAERMAFAEQVRTFSRARSVVGLHGAGLANMTWCAPGVRVAEISAPSLADRGCFWALASALGLEYAAVIGREVPLPAKRPDIACSEASVDEIVGWVSSGSAKPLSSVFG